MARVQTCDICGKPATIVGKLYLTPAGTKNDHGHYSSRMEFGECCLTKVHQLGKWQKRKFRKTTSAKAVA